MVHVAHSNLYNHPLPEGHRFPMDKYDRIPEQLLSEGTINEEQIFAPADVDDEIILLTHCPDYLERLRNNQVSRKESLRIGFPWSAQLLDREINICSGTLQCAKYALKYGAALNVAGGTHHAFHDRGEGFCILNDIAIAANAIINQALAGKILSVDLDVHQGNGTAALFADEPQIFTFSMHGRSNFPFHKEESDMDIALPDGINDEHYLKLLDFHLNKCLESFKPDLVFYQSGVDILECDKLGKLSISLEGVKERDRMVISRCSERDLPLVAVMGGGYSEYSEKITEAHCNTFRLVTEYYR